MSNKIIGRTCYCASCRILVVVGNDGLCMLDDYPYTTYRCPKCSRELIIKEVEEWYNEKYVDEFVEEELRYVR